VGGEGGKEGAHYDTGPEKESHGTESWLMMRERDRRLLEKEGYCSIKGGGKQTTYGKKERRGKNSEIRDGLSGGVKSAWGPAGNVTSRDTPPAGGKKTRCQKLEGGGAEKMQKKENKKKKLGGGR